MEIPIIITGKNNTQRGIINASYQAKAIAIGISKGNPLAEIGRLLQYVHPHASFSYSV